MLKKSMTENAHHIIYEQVKGRKKDTLIAVDGTVGNGLDLRFLSGLESVRQVIGFDIQSKALSVSYSGVVGTSKTVQLVLASHEQIDRYVTTIDIAMFNFGYLPNGDKHKTTQSKSSLEAVQKAIALLAPQGIITLMTYPGHKEGQKEDKIINDYVSNALEKNITVFELSLKNIKGTAPRLYIIKK